MFNASFIHDVLRYIENIYQYFNIILIFVLTISEIGLIIKNIKEIYGRVTDSIRHELIKNL